MKTTFKLADLKMSILSNVHRCWLAMPPVAGFLEMFAGVPYNREKNEGIACTSLHVQYLNILIICQYYLILIYSTFSTTTFACIPFAKHYL